MSSVINHLSDSEKADEKRAFALWQSRTRAQTDEYTLKKRKAELYALVRKVIKNELEPLQQEISHRFIHTHE